MNFYSLLLYLTEFLQLFLYVVVLVVVVVAWGHRPGKGLFIAFVTIAFLVRPLVQGVAHMARYVLWQNGIGGNSNWLGYCLEFGFPILLVGLQLLSGALLLAFAIRHAKGELQAGDKNALDLELRGLGPRWETQIPALQLVSILRRREWAYMIDFSPVLIGTLLYIVVFQRIAGGVSGSSWAILVTITVFSVPFLTLYWIFKDAWGLSIGKRLAGCRVVSVESGLPIGGGISFIRNFLLLIPLMALVELLFASVRKDGRRLGDLIGGTVVVMGPPKWIDGEEVIVRNLESTAENVVHPLDD